MWEVQMGEWGAKAATKWAIRMRPIGFMDWGIMGQENNRVIFIVFDGLF